MYLQLKNTEREIINYIFYCLFYGMGHNTESIRNFETFKCHDDTTLHLVLQLITADR